MLLPKAFETAMSARPFLATSIDARKSGKLVPPATNVRPSGPMSIPSASWKASIECSTMSSTKSPIQAMATKNVAMYQPLSLARRQSGIV